MKYKYFQSHLISRTDIDIKIQEGLYYTPESIVEEPASPTNHITIQGEPEEILEKAIVSIAMLVATQHASEERENYDELVNNDRIMELFFSFCKKHNVDGKKHVLRIKLKEKENEKEE